MRETFQSGTTYFPPGIAGDASQQKGLTGPLDPSTAAGTALGVNDQWFRCDPPPSAPSTNPPTFSSLVFDEQWTGSSPDSSRWAIYNNTSFDSSGQRIQVYKTANVIVGPSTAGGVGNSIKMRAIEIDAGSGTLPGAGVGNNGTRYSYTAAMMDTKSAGFYLPRYNRIECRAKIPHGQGIWPALWYTAKNGGATMCEVDLIEYFCAQLPGHNKTSVHGTDNSGTFTINRVQMYQNQWFENPTYTPGWNVWAFEIVPVTDASGATLADPHSPSNYVRFRVYLNDVKVHEWVDTSATKWSTDGGSEDSFWNIYFQGAQIDGKFVGHPRSPLGYDHERDTCINSGTAPNACSLTYPFGGGHNDARNIQAVFTPPAADFEVDYIRVWKFTG